MTDELGVLLFIVHHSSFIVSFPPFACTVLVMLVFSPDYPLKIYA
jgi:hypothetical protein